jgi:hypothetical protein
MRIPSLAAEIRALLDLIGSKWPPAAADPNAKTPKQHENTEKK